MADRDIFTRGLGRHWSKVGRLLAGQRVGPPPSLQACLAIANTLNDGGGIPRALFSAVCDLIAQARHDRQSAPLFDDAASHYARRQEVRATCARFPEVKLRKLLVEAVSRVLVAERGVPVDCLPKVQEAVARGIGMEVFEERFAGPAIPLLQAEGLSAHEARWQVDACRVELLELEEFHRLTRSVARRPEATRRRIRSSSPSKAATQELLYQPIAALAVGVGRPAS